MPSGPHVPPHAMYHACDVPLQSTEDRPPYRRSVVTPRLGLWFFLGFTTLFLITPNDIAARLAVSNIRSRPLQLPPRAIALRPTAALPRNVPFSLNALPVNTPAPPTPGRAPEQTRPELPAPTQADDEAGAKAILAALRERHPTRPLGYFTPRFMVSVAELIRRHGNPIEYYIDKLSQIVDWRREEAVDFILDQKFPRLDPGVMFWSGVDFKGQPVLFVRPGLVDMAKFDEAKTYRTVIAVIEEGIARMGDSALRFSVVIDTTGVGVRYFLPTFIKKLFNLMALPYRYRLGTVLVGPTNPIVNAVWAIARPIIPPNFKKNVILSSNPMAELRALMPPADIPKDLFR